MREYEYYRLRERAWPYDFPDCRPIILCRSSEHAALDNNSKQKRAGKSGVHSAIGLYRATDSVDYLLEITVALAGADVIGHFSPHAEAPSSIDLPTRVPIPRIVVTPFD